MKKNLCYFSALILAIFLNLGFAPFNYIGIFPIIFFFILNFSYQIDLNKFFLGWFFGFGKNFLNLFWLNKEFLTDYNTQSLTIFFLSFLMIALSACFLGLMFLFFDKLKSSKYSDLLLFSLLWAITEYLETNIFTKFPWNFLGYGLVEFATIAQIASIIGIYGLSFLVIFVSGNFYFLFSYPKKLKIYFFILFIPALSYCYGHFKLQNNLSFTEDLVRIVQPNIAHKIKESKSEKHQNLMKLLSLTSKNLPENLKLIIWPESSLSYQIEDPYFRKLVQNILPERTNLILGNLRITDKYFFNSIYVLNNYGKVVNYYDQETLTIFERYINLNPLIHNYTQKKTEAYLKNSRHSSNARGHSLPDILFSLNSEIIFTEIIYDRFHKQKWLLNLANDQYFGEKKIFYQQILAMAKMRAIEFGLPLIRVSNDGISGIFDSYGRKIFQTKINQSIVTDHYLPKNIDPSLYSKIGPRKILLLYSFVLSFFILRKFSYFG